MSRIGEYISQKRQERNITQKQLAEMLHLSPSAVSKWENGVALPHISCFAQIADALDVSIEELYALTREDSLVEGSSEKGTSEEAAVEDAIENLAIEGTDSDATFVAPEMDEEIAVNVKGDKGKKVSLSTLYIVVALSVLLTAVVILLITSLPETVATVKNDELTLEVIDEYFKDDEEYFGYTKIYYIIIEYDGELTDENLPAFDAMLREKYPDKFEQSELVIVLIYENISEYESGAKPKQKITLIPE